MEIIIGIILIVLVLSCAREAGGLIFGGIIGAAVGLYFVGGLIGIVVGFLFGMGFVLKMVEG